MTGPRAAGCSGDVDGDAGVDIDDANGSSNAVPVVGSGTAAITHCVS